MEIEALKTEINTEVQKRAEELAKDEIRNLTLAKKRTENMVKSAQREIEELDKKISEVKVENFEEDALSSVIREQELDALTNRVLSHSDKMMGRMLKRGF